MRRELDRVRSVAELRIFPGSMVVADLRWSEETKEAMELLYRIQVAYWGSLLESEAQEIDSWMADAAKRAERLWWLVAKALTCTGFS